MQQKQPTFDQLAEQHEATGQIELAASSWDVVLLGHYSNRWHYRAVLRQGWIGIFAAFLVEDSGYTMLEVVGPLRTGTEQFCRELAPSSRWLKPAAMRRW